MVRTVDMANFFRTLPNSIELMLMDIEGSEYETLAQMMQKNVLCQKTVKTALIEAHEWGEITHWGDASSFLSGVHPRSFKAVHQRVQQLIDFNWCESDKVTAIGQLDDESYSNDVDEDFGKKKAMSSLQLPTTIEKASEDAEGYEHPDWLSSCKQIFVDLGSNIGVNVRKLYEPEKYHGAKLLPELEKAFGAAADRRKPETGLCALGFEPNPAHQDRLAKIEDAYSKHGLKVHFYPYAAWRSDGFMALNTTGKREPSASDKSSEGAHLSMRSVQWPGAKEIMVRTVDMANFVQTLPAGSVKLMLMDIEGSEYETLAQMMQKNILCQKTVDTALVDAHGWGEITHWGDASSFVQGVHPRSYKAVHQRIQQLLDFDWCKPGKVTAIGSMDDESYSNDVDDKFGQM